MLSESTAVVNTGNLDYKLSLRSYVIHHRKWRRFFVFTVARGRHELCHISSWVFLTTVLVSIYQAFNLP